VLRKEDAKKRKERRKRKIKVHTDGFHLSSVLGGDLPHKT
jgi:predicted N-acyltransferase